MSNYPGAIDSAASLYSPVDAFSGAPLETTTTGAVLPGDSTISVSSTSGGFAATYGVLSIDNELIVYTGKTATQFTGCQRGAFGTAAAAHTTGRAVKANMVAGFINALQLAVLAIENELGIAAARNYVLKTGAVTVTGLKTFQDGAEFGVGTKAGTGLVRLPNLGAVKWRKQDNSGDLGMALNASNHLAMDAVIDFAAGQTFGAFSYPDATTGAKGIVQIDAVGGLAVAAGVVSLTDTAVIPGTYPKTTVDQKGRVTAGASLVAGDLPSHTHTASDIVAGSLPFTIQNNGGVVGTRRALNLIQGSNIGLTFLDVPASDRVNVTVALASVPAHSHPESDVTNLTADLAGKAPLVHTHAQSDVTGLVTALAGKAPTSHTHAGTDITSAAPVTTKKGGTVIGTRRGLNFIEGTNVTLTVADDAGNDCVNITVAAAAGGTSHNLLSATHPDTVVAAPVLGDLVAANGTPAWARFAGNTTSTRKFLRQTGTGTISALPAWETLVAGDIPTHNHSAGDINSGTLALARGGAAADLSATGPGFLKQATPGSAVTVAVLAAGDVPNLDTSQLTTGLLPVSRGGTGATLAATGPGFLKQTGSGAVVTVATLVAGDLPAHTHAGTDVTSPVPFAIKHAGATVGTRRSINLIDGGNVTLTMVDDSGNDAVNVTIAATAGGSSNHNLLSGTHPDTVPASPVLGDLIVATATPEWARFAGNTTGTRKFMRQTGTGAVSTLPVWDTLIAGDLPSHTHAAGDVTSGLLTLARGGTGADLSATGPGFLKQASGGAVVTVAAIAESDVTNLATDLTNRPGKGAAWAVSKAAVINSSGQLDGAAGTATDCVLVNGTSASKANAVHTHAESDITGLVTDLAGKAASVHTHTSSQISDATANATASTVVLRDGSGGANFAYAAANSLWAYLDSHFNSVECGPFQSAGGPYENMLKYSEDFSVGTWDKNGGTCTVSANAVAAPDGNTTADSVTASGAAGLIRQNVAGLVANGQYTFYVWLKVPSGTMTVSVGILDNGWTTWLVGPTAVTLTTSWQRFKVTATMTGGATALWVAIGHYSDGWTSGLTFHAWGACLQQDNDPKKAYARTWGYQTAPVAAGVACGPVIVSATNNTESPFKVRGPGSPLADHTLLEVTAGGELIIAGGTGNGYRLAEIVGASNPSGWSGCLKVKNPAGVTAGYILLYSNP